MLAAEECSLLILVAYVRKGSILCFAIFEKQIPLSLVWIYIYYLDDRIDPLRWGAIKNCRISFFPLLFPLFVTLFSLLPWPFTLTVIDTDIYPIISIETMAAYKNP